MHEPGARGVSTPEYSFVIPILDEHETLPELHRRLSEVMDQMDGPAEVVFVDDGSTDGSVEVLIELNARDPRVKAVRLSRNFGHQIAITAGLDHARGRAVIIMDGDLQDPPEVALDMARKWREGFDVVYAVRDERAGESRFKLATASWFYRLLGSMSEIEIPADAGDFRLVDRRAVDAVGEMREHRRYLRGMFAWVGYDQTGVHYSRDARHAGTTKFPFRRMFRFATDGVASFSAAPLRLALQLGFVVSFLAFFGGTLTVVLKIAGVDIVPGWASIVVGVMFFAGIQLIVLGVMGEYIARIYEEVKQRPLYLTRDTIGFDGPRSAELRTEETRPCARRLTAMAEFDAHADSYDDQIARSISFCGTEHEYFTRRKADEIGSLARRLLGDPGTLSVLDVGCGVGLTDELLGGAFGDLQGVDVSAETVGLAAERNPDVAYATYDGAVLPYADDTFDLTFAICVAHHVPLPERPAFASELARVVRPGGLVAVFEHNPYNPLTRVAVSRCEFDEGVVLLSRRRVRGLLADAGLHPVEARYVIFTTIDRPWMVRAEHTLRGVPLGAQHYVVARQPG